MASRRRTLSRETVGDMRCRALDAPAPGAAGTTRPPVATPCDASPDLGSECFGWSWARARSSPRRPRHATPVTNSLSMPNSLQLLPGPAHRETGEPPGDTLTRLRRSGPPPSLHREGKHDPGGRWQRRRNRTPHKATQLGLDGRSGNATPLGGDRTPTRVAQHGHATHMRKPLDRRTGPDHGFVNCGHLGRRTRQQDRTRHNATEGLTGLHNALPLTAS